MRSDLVDIEMQMHARTDRAILVSSEGERDDAVWLPLAQVEVAMRDGGVVEVTMPEWLAIDRGLV